MKAVNSVIECGPWEEAPFSSHTIKRPTELKQSQSVIEQTLT